MLIAIKHPPFNNSHSMEALELYLGLSSVGMDIELLFIEDGIFHLTANKNTTNLAIKNFLPNLNALKLYDIHTIYVCKSSMSARSITRNDLDSYEKNLQIQFIDSNEVLDLLNTKCLIL